MATTLAFDPGYGNVKLYGAKGRLVMPSIVAVGRGEEMRRMAGLRIAKPPLRVETKTGLFHVGENAHEWGRPVENLDFDRLTGAPEMLALLYGAMTLYGVPLDPIALIVGLPVGSLMGEAGTTTQQGVRDFLRGTHTWRADGMSYTMTVENILMTSQPVGAMFDYLLSDTGEMPSDRRNVFKGEIGILGIGMNTVELLVVSNGAPVQRFTAGGSLGVRRLLELASSDGLYSLGELDTRLRAGSLDTRDVLPVWQSEVVGFVEKHWGASFRRFATVVMIGGGVEILRDALLARFRDQAFVPDDPVMATARGLYKYSLMRARREG